jgi:hypothetical protein
MIGPMSSIILRVLLLAGMAVAGLTAQGASGRWVGNISDGGATSRVYLYLWQQDLTLTGTVTYAGAILPIENAVTTRDQVTFETRDGSSVTTYRLTVVAGQLTGQVIFGARSVQLDLSPLPSEEKVVILLVQTSANGRSRNMKVLRSVRGKDQAAMEAVQNSKLNAGTVEVIFPQ